MSYDYSRLQGRIREKFGTQEKFATAINLSRVSLSLTLNSKREFTQDEINKSIKALDLLVEDIPAYFFKQKV